jgi:hypothetical protein
VSKSWNRKLTALDVGEIFFPQRVRLGLEARELTPKLVEKIVFAGAESRSMLRAKIVLDKIGDVAISISTIERVLRDVGSELKDLRECAPSRLPKSLVPPLPAGPPKLAVVMADGGRMMTRQPGHGRGVHQQAWRETKNASFESMSHQTFENDPQPEIPQCFTEPKHVAEICGNAPLDVSVSHPVKKKPHRASESERARTLHDASLSRSTDATENGTASTTEAFADIPDHRPKRLLRTCLSSLACSSDFGLQMSRESQRRQLHKATARAFIGDGLSWNWIIWKKYFPTFEPILDFMHAVEYVHAAAVLIHGDDQQAAWCCYLKWAQACWSGNVAIVIPELLAWLQSRGLDPSATLDDKHPDKAVHDAHRYLTNNTSRMAYARYRRAGLPVTSAPMESLVKQVNLRVKGTEMFWNDAKNGGECILQIKAAALSDDSRLETYLCNRPGSPFVRKHSNLASATSKS